MIGTLDISCTIVDGKSGLMEEYFEVEERNKHGSEEIENKGEFTL